MPVPIRGSTSGNLPNNLVVFKKKRERKRERERREREGREEKGREGRREATSSS